MMNYETIWEKIKDYAIFGSVLFILWKIGGFCSLEFLNCFLESGYSSMAGELVPYQLEKVKLFSAENMRRFIELDLTDIMQRFVNLLQVYADDLTQQSPDSSTRKHRREVMAAMRSTGSAPRQYVHDISAMRPTGIATRGDVIAALKIIQDSSCHWDWKMYNTAYVKWLQPITPLSLFYSVSDREDGFGIDGDLNYKQYIRRGLWATVRVVIFNDPSPELILQSLDVLLFLFIYASRPVITITFPQ